MGQLLLLPVGIASCTLGLALIALLLLLGRLRLLPFGLVICQLLRNCLHYPQLQERVPIFDQRV
jgi:hypothetical protein